MREPPASAGGGYVAPRPRPRCPSRPERSAEPRPRAPSCCDADGSARKPRFVDGAVVEERAAGALPPPQVSSALPTPPPRPLGMYRQLDQAPGAAVGRQKQLDGDCGDTVTIVCREHFPPRRGRMRQDWRGLRRSSVTMRTGPSSDDEHVVPHQHVQPSRRSSSPSPSPSAITRRRHHCRRRLRPPTPPRSPTPPASRSTRRPPSTPAQGRGSGPPPPRSEPRVHRQRAVRSPAVRTRRWAS
eukprot:COSAG04_NODE_2980_length_3321_cov_17.861887_2_plen_242_part_00